MAYKELDPNCTEFKTEKHTYKVKVQVTFDEWKAFEDLEFQTGMGHNFKYVYDELNRLWASIQKGQFGTLSVIVYNLMFGIKHRMENRSNVVLMLCTLFIIRDGDYARVWTEEIAKEYIDDWGKEYYINSFFSLAVSLVRGFAEAYENLSLNFSEKLINTLKNITPDGSIIGTSSGTKSQSESVKTTDSTQKK